jgi:hypothetical protein
VTAEEGGAWDREGGGEKVCRGAEVECDPREPLERPPPIRASAKSTTANDIHMAVHSRPMTATIILFFIFIKPLP